MSNELLLKIAISVFILLITGIGLTIYEFREHIIEHKKKSKAKNH